MNTPGLTHPADVELFDDTLSCEVTLPALRPRTIALGRSDLGPGALAGGSAGGVVLLVEDLTDERALAAQVAHQERLASIGRLAAGVAHEVGNPLTGVKLTAANLRRELTDPDVRARLDLILGAGDRIDRIVRALVGYAHAGDAARGPRGPVALAPLVADAVTLTRLSKAGKQLELRAEVPPTLAVTGDRPQLEQVIVNLLANAGDASSLGGEVTVTARAAGDQVIIEVIDRGAGMTPEVAARALDPFFTTKPPGEGTGLGLSQVYGFARQSGGSVEIESVVGQGSTVSLLLPVVEADPTREPATTIATSIAGAASTRSSSRRRLAAGTSRRASAVARTMKSLSVMRAAGSRPASSSFKRRRAATTASIAQCRWR